MRDENKDTCVGLEVLLEPHTRLQVKMVRGLIEQEHLRGNKEGTKGLASKKRERDEVKGRGRREGSQKFEIRLSSKRSESFSHYFVHHLSLNTLLRRT